VLFLMADSSVSAACTLNRAVLSNIVLKSSYRTQTDDCLKFCHFNAGGAVSTNLILFLTMWVFTLCVLRRRGSSPGIPIR
jgi:hypothetical protein